MGPDILGETSHELENTPGKSGFELPQIYFVSGEFNIHSFGRIAAEISQLLLQKGHQSLLVLQSVELEL